MSGGVNPALEEQRDSGSLGLVSVIIPAYNAAPYIKETLDSVFAQTYPHFQVIVVNDGSPDTPELEQVLAPYLSRVIYITQENRGLSGARNTGLRAATGNLVALLDADDIWLPNYLERQTCYLNEHPERDLVYCNARFFGDSVYNGKEFMDVCPSKGEPTSLAIISRRCHVFVSILARRQALLTVGFDESLRSCEDFDCWIRFTAAGHTIGYQREILVLYRKHKASLSANTRSMAEFSICVISKSLSIWPAESEEARLLRQAKVEKTAELQNLLGKLALLDRDFAAALTHFRAANSYYRSRKLSVVIVLIGLVPSLVRATYKLRAVLFSAHRTP
jgi:glycosyltransferase involved in cell wall biosynthesis